MDVVNGDITFKANEKLNMPANPQKIGFKFRGGMPIRKELVKKYAEFIAYRCTI